MNSWILILYGLPTRQNAARVQLWRKLKKFGAIALKTSAYVLPDKPVHFERFQWLATQIRSGGGEATLIRVSEIEGLPQEKVVQLFNDARAKDYSDLVAELSDFIRANKRKLTDDFHVALEKYQARLHELREMDYFSCPKAQDALMLLKQAETLLSRGSAQDKGRVSRKRFNGRQWLTRPRPHIDRVGSAWLIRRFIDAKASFVFSPNSKDFPDAVPYDMFEVDFSHQGDDCTFETLVKRFGIEDKAVLTIAEMIHDADLEDGKFKRNECIGIDRVLSGWNKMGIGDQQVLTKGFDVFDALYEGLKR
jgi:hypothetical protein